MTNEEKFHERIGFEYDRMQHARGIMDLAGAIVHERKLNDWLEEFHQFVGQPITEEHAIVEQIEGD